jgi:hypothetical protein
MGLALAVLPLLVISIAVLWMPRENAVPGIRIPRTLTTVGGVLVLAGVVLTALEIDLGAVCSLVGAIVLVASLGALTAIRIRAMRRGA